MEVARQDARLHVGKGPTVHGAVDLPRCPVALAVARPRIVRQQLGSMRKDRLRQAAIPCCRRYERRVRLESSLRVLLQVDDQRKRRRWRTTLLSSRTWR